MKTNKTKPDKKRIAKPDGKSKKADIATKEGKFDIEKDDEEGGKLMNEYLEELYNKKQNEKRIAKLDDNGKDIGTTTKEENVTAPKTGLANDYIEINGEIIDMYDLPYGGTYGGGDSQSMGGDYSDFI